MCEFLQHTFDNIGQTELSCKQICCFHGCVVKKIQDFVQSFLRSLEPLQLVQSLVVFPYSNICYLLLHNRPCPIFFNCGLFMQSDPCCTECLLYLEVIFCIMQNFPCTFAILRVVIVMYCCSSDNSHVVLSHV